MIVGNNSILNQFVPTFQIKCLLDGQILVYDSCKKAFVNVSVCETHESHEPGLVRDLIDTCETVKIAARHQYIVTSEIEIAGHIINHGVLAIL